MIMKWIGPLYTIYTICQNYGGTVERVENKSRNAIILFGWVPGTVGPVQWCCQSPGKISNILEIPSLKPSCGSESAIIHSMKHLKRNISKTAYYPRRRGQSITPLCNYSVHVQCGCTQAQSLSCTAPESIKTKSVSGRDSLQFVMGACRMNNSLNLCYTVTGRFAHIRMPIVTNYNWYQGIFGRIALVNEVHVWLRFLRVCMVCWTISPPLMAWCMFPLVPTDNRLVLNSKIMT